MMTQADIHRMRNNLPAGCPVTSPWGKVQQAEAYTFNNGKRDYKFYFVSTSSHGGYKLSAYLNNQIPDVFRVKNGWYEEDCDYAIVHYFFSQHFPQHKEAAARSLKNWHWKEWENHFNVTLAPGESYKKDEYTFLKEHENDWIVISAIGIDDGMVRCHATKGGKRGDGYTNPEQRVFIVPDSEYEKRNNAGFVIDLDKHEYVTSKSQLVGY